MSQIASDFAVPMAAPLARDWSRRVAGARQRGRAARPAVGPVTRRTAGGTGTVPLRVRWGRVVSLALIALLAGTAVLVWRGTAQATGAAAPRGDGAVVTGSTGALREHVVAPGDTLWALAEAAAPQSDPRETVDRIMRINGRAAGSLQVGEVVLLPR